MAKKKEILTIQDLYRYCINRASEHQKLALPGVPDLKWHIGKVDAYNNMSNKILELMQRTQEQVKP